MVGGLVMMRWGEPIILPSPSTSDLKIVFFFAFCCSSLKVMIQCSWVRMWIVEGTEAIQLSPERKSKQPSRLSFTIIWWAAACELWRILCTVFSHVERDLNIWTGQTIRILQCSFAHLCLSVSYQWPVFSFFCYQFVTINAVYIPLWHSSVSVVRQLASTSMVNVQS